MTTATSSTGFDTPERRALQQFLLRRTLPLISHTADQIWFQGTGSLFTRGGNSYLITAGHVFDNVALSAVHLPLGRGEAEIESLGQCRLHRSNDESDIAVIVLEASLANQLRAEWAFLDDSNVEVDDSSHTRFLVAGFPSVTGVPQSDGILAQHLTQVYTGRYQGSEATAAPESDLLFDCAGRVLGLHPLARSSADGQTACGLALGWSHAFHVLRPTETLSAARRGGPTGDHACPL